MQPIVAAAGGEDQDAAPGAAVLSRQIAGEETKFADLLDSWQSRGHACLGVHQARAPEDDLRASERPARDAGARRDAGGEQRGTSHKNRRRQWCCGQNSHRGWPSL